MGRLWDMLPHGVKRVSYRYVKKYVTKPKRQRYNARKQAALERKYNKMVGW